MTIDPLTIPCPFCGDLPVIKYWVGSIYHIYCENCEMALTPDTWITGGINALVGKLARLEQVRFFTKDGFHQSWDWGYSWDNTYEDEILPRNFDSFEEAVLDAWEKLKMRDRE